MERATERVRGVRYHPRFWLGLSLFLALLAFGYTFNIYSGFLSQAEPVQAYVAGLEDLDKPPIIVVSKGELPGNMTSTVLTSGPRLSQGRILGPVTVYEYWYYWPPNDQHPANFWEPVYVYYDLGSFRQPKLFAIGTRVHFEWTLVMSGFAVNGTRPIVAFSQVFHIPLVVNNTLSLLFYPRNATSIYDYPVIRDPGSPPAVGPRAYQNDEAGYAGPIDPWLLLGSPQTVQNGIAYGSLAGLAVFTVSQTIILYTVHPGAGRKKVRVRKRLFPYLLED